MADFITTKEISSKIEEIIKKSKKKLVLVSPYLQISNIFLERLKDASNRGVNIKIVYGKDNLNKLEFKQLSSLNNLDLYFYEQLHAKCYFNESKMVITSMNLYEYSEKNNREMGIIIDRISDNAIFDEAINETKSIIENASKIEVFKDGFCIRCEEIIDYNLSKPLCNACFQVWTYWENWDYLENFCHKCGKNFDSSKAIPLCETCSKDGNF